MISREEFIKSNIESYVQGFDEALDMLSSALIGSLPEVIHRLKDRNRELFKQKIQRDFSALKAENDSKMSDS